MYFNSIILCVLLLQRPSPRKCYRPKTQDSKPLNPCDVQGIKDLIDRCLLPAPDQRPSAKEIYNILQAELKHGPGAPAAASCSTLNWPATSVSTDSPYGLQQSVIGELPEGSGTRASEHSLAPQYSRTLASGPQAPGQPPAVGFQWSTAGVAARAGGAAEPTNPFETGLKGFSPS